jgi:hypothetical protein
LFFGYLCPEHFDFFSSGKTKAVEVEGNMWVIPVRDNHENIAKADPELFDRIRSGY